MAKDLSSDFKKRINAVSSDERPLVLLEIDHTDLTSPIRVVNDTDDVVSNGNNFIALAFRITLPDQKEQGLPHASLEVDNIGKEMVSWLELSGGGQGATVRVMIILRSNPDIIEYDITLNLSNVVLTQETVSGDLTFEDIMNKPSFNVTYRPHTHPGLF